MTTARALRNALTHAEQGDRLLARGEWTSGLLLYRLGQRELGVPATIEELPGGTEHEAAAERDRLLALAAGVLREKIDPIADKIRSRKRRMAGIAAAALVALALGLGWRSVVYQDISVGCPWVASSDAMKAPRKGLLPERSWRWAMPAYFFHTKKEASPWIQVDLRELRAVRGVELVNRLDCCHERARRLRIEVSPDGTNFEPVAFRNARIPARRWRATFPERRARWVRVVSLQEDPLHLADLVVLGS